MKVKKAYIAKSISECVELLVDNTKIIAGGTDIIIKLNEGHLSDVSLVDISKLEELRFINKEDDVITIGANTTYTDILDRPDIFKGNLEGFYNAIKSVGSPQIRNRGTIGGNICNGSPAADSVPPLLVLDAKLKIIGKNGERIMPLKDFFKGKQEVDLNNELLHSITFNVPKLKLNFYKYSPRNALAITWGSIASIIEVESNIIKDIKIASGGFSAYCMRELEMENALIGKSTASIDGFLDMASSIVMKRIEDFPKDFKEMKEVTIKSAFRHVLGGHYDN